MKFLGKSFLSITFGAQGVGQASSFMPDYAKCKISIANVLDLLQTVPKINNWPQPNEGIIPPSDSEIKEIRLESVEFNYPGRPEIKVYTLFNTLSYDNISK